MLNYNKWASLATLVESAEKDSKKLFRIVNSLLGRKEENPMLLGKTDSELAEGFADIFPREDRQNKRQIQGNSTLST